MKNTTILVALVCIVAAISSCAPQSKFSRSSYAWAASDAADYSLKDYSGMPGEAVTIQEVSTDAEIENFSGMKVYNASMELKVKNTDSTVARLHEIAKASEGYVSNSNSWATTLKVKAANLEMAMGMVEELGKVSDRSISVEDITAQYNDVEIRLDNAEKARLRYLELLSKAENVEAALKVEKELERLNGEIDLLKGQLNLMKHREQYSTLTVRINERDKLGILGYVFVGAYKGVRWLFVRG